MIHGVNPYTISKITGYKFQRYGPHPAWTKLMNKRNPIRGLLGFYSGDFFDGIYRAGVTLYGADGSMLKHIACRSNDHAKRLCSDLNHELAQWVADTRRSSVETQ